MTNNRGSVTVIQVNSSAPLAQPYHRGSYIIQPHSFAPRPQARNKAYVAPTVQGKTPPPLPSAPPPEVGKTVYSSGMLQASPSPLDRQPPGSFGVILNKTDDPQHNKLIIGSAIGTAIILVLMVLICCLKRKRLLGNAKIFRKENKKNENIKLFLKSRDLLTLRQYTYWEIKKMTNSFMDRLGEGGFGDVYKGTLPDGRLVAVKVLNDSKSNGEDFINEVSSISRTSHVNIVSLLGFCYQPKRVLIYEYMPNGSLDKLIYNQGSSSTNCALEWKMLYEIAIGIARGLEYLHRGCNTRILHFDIKPHNILLDENFCAKISDFGLAKLGTRDQSSVSMLGPRGTRGYIAPEVCSNHFGRVSYKSDVYSYGMMVVEMVGRRKNIDPSVSEMSRIYFPHYVFKHIEAGQDLKLVGVKNQEEEDIAKKMILVSLWCIQTNPSDRPTMTGVLEMLESRIESLLLPPNPFVSSPTASP